MVKLKGYFDVKTMNVVSTEQRQNCIKTKLLFFFLISNVGVYDVFLVSSSAIMTSQLMT